MSVFPQAIIANYEKIRSLRSKLHKNTTDFTCLRRQLSGSFENFRYWICISTNNSDTFYSSQDMSISVQNSSYCSSLASTSLVLRGVTTTSISPDLSSVISKITNMSKRKIPTSKSPISGFSHLGVIKQSIRDKKFSQNVADFVSKSRRASTQKVYDAKWVVYSNWCHRKTVNLVSTPITVIANFLIYLFSEKKKNVR